MEGRIRVVLVDDHTIVRAGLKVLLNLEPDMEVIGEAGTGAEGVERVRALRPDVVVMDLEMPEMSGLDATREILAAGVDTRILVLTS
ncbi:MAG TPA: response regulator transcription factor, partial [Longimicrobium sp.]